jgi:hypothetical protein
MFHAAKVTSIKVKVIRSILQNDNKNSSFSQASVNVYIKVIIIVMIVTGAIAIIFEKYDSNLHFAFFVFCPSFHSELPLHFFFLFLQWMSNNCSKLMFER